MVNILIEKHFKKGSVLEWMNPVYDLNTIDYNGFGLSVEQAKNIQDQFAEFIISKISTEYKIIKTL